MLPLRRAGSWTVVGVPDGSLPVSAVIRGTRPVDMNMTR
jgi:hypothetical protein